MLFCYLLVSRGSIWLEGYCNSNFSYFLNTPLCPVAYIMLKLHNKCWLWKIELTINNVVKHFLRNWPFCLSISSAALFSICLISYSSNFLDQLILLVDKFTSQRKWAKLEYIILFLSFQLLYKVLMYILSHFWWN